MIARALLFIVFFGALQLSWQWLDGGRVHRLVIDQGVVGPAAALARTMTPELGIHATGNRLLGVDGGVNIVNGCDGIETVFLLFAGFLVAPLAWRDRLFGFGVGILVVYVLNLGRILVLFYAHRGNPDLFAALHGVVTPVLMVLAIAAYYYFWLRRDTNRPTNSIA